MNKVALKAAAKINLLLDVTGKREDGYHLIESVMQSVSLYDIVTVAKSEADVITCTDSAIPCDEHNIAKKAANAFFSFSGISPQPLDIHIEKHIPSQAGLGGGSADGAAVLTALQQLYGNPLSEEELRKAGLSVGADLPFCLFGGTVLATGIGEVLELLPPMPSCTILLAQPKVGISTAAAYAEIDRAEHLPHPNLQQFLSALRRGDITKISANVGNLFEAVTPLPELSELREIMLLHGALCSCMSGSGSAMFGIFTDADSANRCASALQKQGIWNAIANPTHNSVEILAAE